MTGGAAFTCWNSEDGWRFFYPQIAQIDANDGGLSCRYAVIHAAGIKALFRPHAKTRRREEDREEAACLAATR
ncbi:hypothetical protein J3R75_003947 [Oligosphaera ethanolica]|uniref:Uncharacterized protein n=1 Tax=Oligosphaera ethanolica TaxID=760260 RepID=A0AAE3VK11_9BACT|nr:hypothetical protein [Oligosphaera ethanolica]